MDNLSELEAAADIRGRAAAQGFDVSEAKLARWHREGLIPKPEQRPLGKGKGTISLYPEGTGNQVLTLCQIRLQHRDLNEIGFRLWWLGFPVSDKYGLERLKLSAQIWDKHVAKLREIADALEGDDDGKIDQFYDALDDVGELRISKKFVRQIRKRIGSKNFATLAMFVLYMATGRFDAVASALDDRETQIDNTIIEKAMGLTFARKHQLPGVPPWLIGDVRETFADLSKAIASTTFIDLYEALSTSEILQARDEIRDLCLGLAAVAETFQKMFGKNPFGFGTISSILEHATANDLAWVLFGWCLIKARPFAQDYQTVIDACRFASGVARGFS